MGRSLPFQYLFDRWIDLICSVEGLIDFLICYIIIAGYVFQLDNMDIIDAPTDDSIQVGPAGPIDKLIKDPITHKNIVSRAVHSTKCPRSHLYEEKTLLPLIRKGSQINAHHQPGMKCSYMGCGLYIQKEDLIGDDEYKRFLQRSAQEEEAEL